MRRHFTVVLLALALSSVALSALPSAWNAHSAAPRATAQDPSIHIGVPLVNVYATVLDKHQAIVPNLAQNDFRIFEDKVEQKIAFFSREQKLPLSIGLLIDTSQSETNRIASERMAASQFLHQVIREGDKAFILAFDVNAQLLSDWTDNVDALDAAIHRADIGAGGANKLKPGVFYPNLGGTHLFDTVYAACVKKMTSETGRKTLIIVTDGKDQGSRVSLNRAVESAQRADTLIQVLVVYDEKQDAAFDAAKRLAQDTGGRAIDIFNHNRLQKAFDEISEQLRTEYSFGYYPTNTKLDGAYRQLKLELNGKSYKVLARNGYYAGTAGK